ncbi:hypothetical protein AJ80_06927 [Polytolypa hystricis UAMH7299]|uniref:Uncharacterized protein n=1 Tax=Polytolypa hystricis (strain UAMH7299) TaxID=1447883 RepID=A0A2B7XT69_POLH7|nr:hypothetical protein AJ80_06927 [Polytolypa hystricis UAMH7299]
MAKKLFTGRPRANTAGDISKPTLTHTDALPRSDLQAIGQVSANITDAQSDLHELGHVPADAAEVQRSKTGGHSTRQKHDEWKKSHAFDFQLSEQQQQQESQIEYADNGHGGQMIGVALGSPSLQRSFPPDVYNAVSPPPDRGASRAPSETEEGRVAPLKRKPSKWKKIGGLFRSKTSSPMPRQPFYQVQVNDQPLHAPSSRTASPADLHFQQSYASMHASPPPFPKFTVQNPNGKEIWPALDDRPSTSHASPSKPPKKLINDGKRLTEEPGEYTSPSLQQSPLLDIDIPDIHMERYSVMFGSLLGKNPSSTLLARRSRTLDMLRSFDEGTDEEGHETHTRPRRATSPAPSKSPIFNLFPATPTSKASKVLGSHALPRGPLQRANTAPPSPRPADLYNPPTAATSGSIPLGTSSTATGDSQWERGSFLSTTSSNTSDSSTGEEATVVLKMKPPISAPHDEPVWEMVKPASKPDPSTVERSSSRSNKLQRAKSEETMSHRSRSHTVQKKALTAPTPPPVSVSAIPDPFQQLFDQYLPPPAPPPSHQPPPTPGAAASTTDSIPPPPIPTTGLPPRPRTRSRSKSSSRSPPRCTAIAPTPTPVNITEHHHRRNTPSDIHDTQQQTVEVSIARSVSVSRQRRQLLVPVVLCPPRADSLRPKDRNHEREHVEKRVGKAAPTLIDIPRGYRHEKSQEIEIGIA